MCLVGDMNIHFNNALRSQTKQSLITLSLYVIVQIIKKPTHVCSDIIDGLLFDHQKCTVRDSHESKHYCTLSSDNLGIKWRNLEHILFQNLLHQPLHFFLGQLIKLFFISNSVTIHYQKMHC